MLQRGRIARKWICARRLTFSQSGFSTLDGEQGEGVLRDFNSRIRTRINAVHVDDWCPGQSPVWYVLMLVKGG